MEEKKKGKSHISFKIFILILLGILLFFLKEENQKKFIQFIDRTTLMSLEPMIEDSIFIGEDIEQVFAYEEGIILWKENQISKLSLDGSKEWEREFVFEETGISVGETYIYIYEKPSGIIHFLDNKGETIHRVDIETSIMNLVENIDNILVHFKGTNGEGICILDMEGNIVDSSIVSNRNILTFSVDDEGDLTYLVSSLDLGKDAIKSHVEVFKKGEQSQLDKEFKDEIIFYSNFIHRDKILIMTDKSIYMLKNEDILWEREFQLIKDIYIDRTKIYVLYGNTLETISIDGITQEKISFTEEYKKILPFNGYLIVYGDEYIMGLNRGEELFKYKSDKDVLKLIGGTENLILVYSDKIELMKFNKKI